MRGCNHQSNCGECGEDIDRVRPAYTRAEQIQIATGATNARVIAYALADALVANDHDVASVLADRALQMLDRDAIGAWGRIIAATLKGQI